MKILFLNYDKSIACNHYRSGGIAKDLAKQSGAKIAAMEGTMVGAACLVPHWWDIPSLRYKTPEEYAECLNAMLSGEVDLQFFNDYAWQYIQDNCLLENINKIRKEIIKNL